MLPLGNSCGYFDAILRAPRNEPSGTMSTRSLECESTHRDLNSATVNESSPAVDKNSVTSLQWYNHKAQLYLSNSFVIGTRRTVPSIMRWQPGHRMHFMSLLLYTSWSWAWWCYSSTKPSSQYQTWLCSHSTNYKLARFKFLVGSPLMSHSTSTKQMIQ